MYLKPFLRYCGLAAALAVAITLRAAPTAAQLEKIYADYWEENLQLTPILATLYGDHRFDDRFGPVSVREALADYRRLHQKYLAMVEPVDATALSASDRLNFDLFRQNLIIQIDVTKIPAQYFPINPQFGFHVVIAQFGTGASAQPFATVKDYENWLARGRELLPATESMIADMREGIAKGLTQPRSLIEQAIAQLSRMVPAEPEKSFFYMPIARMPATFSAEDRARLTAAYRAFVTEVTTPAYQKLVAFLKDEYLPHARTGAGLSALPGGAEWYAIIARQFTTTNLTPEEIHQIGLAEVARILGEIDAAMKGMGFTGTRAEFYQYINTDPQFKFKTAEEMQAAFEGMRARVDARVPEFFSRQPKSPFVIKAAEPFREKNAPTAQYLAGTPDGSRPGIFYYKAYKPETQSRYTTEAVFLHEAVPGHHFEISLGREQAGWPAFRRFTTVTAFSEGWGLYSERLGREMGFYTDPAQWVGRLTLEMLRACRLVVDTGIHAKGWTREQALAYMVANVPDSESTLATEVDRYIGFPGQALAYKIGELTIVRLRAEAEKALGAKFDVRAFHDQLLRNGSVPLAVLEADMRRWIAAQER